MQEVQALDDAVKYLRWFLEWAYGIKHWNSFEGWIARIFVWLAFTLTLLWLLQKLLELLVGLRKAWEGLGFSYRISDELREEVTRKRQFARVISNDLTTLGKAENWNDQSFADLEAQVEAEGGYYANAFDRIRNQASTGFRRLPSLMRAIDNSSEQFLLLVGEPGAGKSVALRHFAQQIADSAAASKNPKSLLPLYINLKELPSAPPGGPTADFIRQFVFDNVRRGDADTADYLRDNWDRYRSTGQWLFLFDSFDEIPAVMHSGAGSLAVQQHSEAIRQFLEGMSACRGIVASREFKRPQNVNWSRMRILELSEQTQAELIDRSFLPRAQKDLVSQHIATADTPLHRNPMFLSLLCRYVKEAHATPANDFTLLDRHIQRLAFRDPEYVHKQFALDGAALLTGATRLARLFAEHPDLSLAPSLFEISGAISADEIPAGNIENLLAALVYVKIGRSDVPSAVSSDRRFTFAHRRYQEALFVRFLALNSTYIPARQLLTDSRWREYTVTLLQTQPGASIYDVLHEAHLLLRDFLSRRRTVTVPPRFGGELTYFKWDDQLVRLLELLHAGLSGRPVDIPSELYAVVAELLLPAWNDGDVFDRTQVLRFCGLLDQEAISMLLADAVGHGTPRMLDIAFQRAQFLRIPSTEFAAWVRRRLSNDVLVAAKPSEVLRAEALGARLPAGFCAPYVVARARVLRRAGDLFMKLLTFPVSVPIALYMLVRSRQRFRFDRGLPPRMVEALVINQFAILAMMAVVFWRSQRIAAQSALGMLLLCLWLACLAYMLRFLLLYAFRDAPAILRMRDYFRPKELYKARPNARAVLRFVAMLAMGLAPAAPALFGQEDVSTIILGGSLALVVTVGLGTLIIEYWQRRQFDKDLTVLRRKVCPVAIVLHAMSSAELAVWLTRHKSELVPTVREMRALGRLIIAGTNRWAYDACTHRPKRLFLRADASFDFARRGEALDADE